MQNKIWFSFLVLAILLFSGHSQPMAEDEVAEAPFLWIDSEGFIIDPVTQTTQIHIWGRTGDRESWIDVNRFDAFNTNQFVLVARKAKIPPRTTFEIYFFYVPYPNMSNECYKFTIEDAASVYLSEIWRVYFGM